MKSVWTKTAEGWLYVSQDKTPDMDPGVLTEDPYIKLYIDYDQVASYLLTIDGRRAYHLLVNWSWMSLFFGQGECRKRLKGRILWSDRNVVLTRYGSKPRTYIIVAKKEKGND